MLGSAAHTLPLDRRFSLRQIHGAQLANLALLLTDDAVDDLAVAVRTFVPAGSSAVACIFDDSVLWASILITVDESGRGASVSTLDRPGAGAGGDMTHAAGEVVSWVQTHHGPCSLGFFIDREHAQALLRASDKAESVRAASAAGALVLSPIPPALAISLA